MTREDISEELINLSSSHNNMLIELSTGVGKTKKALELIKYYMKEHTKVLIVVPKNVLKNNWKEEIIKWNMYLENIDYTFTTYTSFPKYAGEWDFIIYDEAHHLTERCRKALEDFNTERSILLSATIPPRMKQELKECFSNLGIYTISTEVAIDNGILPEPKVILIPLMLNNSIPTEEIWKNPKGKTPVIESSWATRWQYIKQKVYKVRIYCTERQYYTDLEGQIEWYKRRYRITHNKAYESKYLRLSGDRLKWLSDKRKFITKTILSKLKDNRTITFCSSIEQTEELGKHCINSKNKLSSEILDKFNNKKIKHIQAVNMLSEGVNLTDCKVGLWAYYNSSQILVTQKIGRILRHKEPVIILPYYKATREEEIVNTMIEGINKDNIIKLDNLCDLKI